MHCVEVLQRIRNHTCNVKFLNRAWHNVIHRVLNDHLIEIVIFDALHDLCWVTIDHLYMVILILIIFFLILAANVTYLLITFMHLSRWMLIRMYQRRHIRIMLRRDHPGIEWRRVRIMMHRVSIRRRRWWAELWSTWAGRSSSSDVGRHHHWINSRLWIIDLVRVIFDARRNFLLIFASLDLFLGN